MNEFSASNWLQEVKRGRRFAFGENWAAFLRLLDDERIRTAEEAGPAAVYEAVITTLAEQR